MPPQDDFEDYGQDWEPVVFTKPRLAEVPPPPPRASRRGSLGVPLPPARFDPAFIAEVRRHRLTLKMDQATYAAQLKVPFATLRDLEENKLPFDADLLGRGRAFMRARQIDP